MTVVDSCIHLNLAQVCRRPRAAAAVGAEAAIVEPKPKAVVFSPHQFTRQVNPIIKNT